MAKLYMGDMKASNARGCKVWGDGEPFCAVFGDDKRVALPEFVEPLPKPRWSVVLSYHLLSDSGCTASEVNFFGPTFYTQVVSKLPQQWALTAAEIRDWVSSRTNELSRKERS